MNEIERQIITRLNLLIDAGTAYPSGTEKGRHQQPQRVDDPAQMGHTGRDTLQVSKPDARILRRRRTRYTPDLRQRRPTSSLTTPKKKSTLAPSLMSTEDHGRNRRLRRRPSRRPPHERHPTGASSSSCFNRAVYDEAATASQPCKPDIERSEQ